MNDSKYLTVDSIQWATGHIRPRMALEEKRAKHRVHQQQFMLRQRQRIEQFQRDMQRHTLQLKVMEASREASVLLRENEAMLQRLQSMDSSVVPATNIPCRDVSMPFHVPCQDRRDPQPPGDSSVDNHEAMAMLELLETFSDFKTLHEDAPSDENPFIWCDGAQADPLAWPNSPTSATTSLETYSGVVVECIGGLRRQCSFP